MEGGVAAFNIAAGEGVAVTLLEIDAVGAGDGAAGAGGAVDVEADEGAGVEPIGGGRICDLVADGVDGGLESREVIAEEAAAGVIAGAVEGHAGLVGVAEKV